MKALNGLAVAILECHGHERVDAGLIASVLPGKGIDNTFVFFDVPELPAHPALAVGFRFDASAPPPARTEVELEARAFENLGTEPAAHVLDVRPNLENHRDRSVKGADNQQFVVAHFP